MLPQVGSDCSSFHHDMFQYIVSLLFHHLFQIIFAYKLTEQNGIAAIDYSSNRLNGDFGATAVVKAGTGKVQCIIVIGL
jgi:hypothetical protein